MANGSEYGRIMHTYFRYYRMELIDSLHIMLSDAHISALNDAFTIVIAMTTVQSSSFRCGIWICVCFFYFLLAFDFQRMK